MYKKFLAAVFALLLSISSIDAQNAGKSSENSRGDDSLNNFGGIFGDFVFIIGLTADGRLIVFSEIRPSRAFTISHVNGLMGDTYLVGIDFRVQDGRLYGVGNAGGVYRIDIFSGNATFVNSLTIPLNGDKFGVDFNPAADRLRVVSDTGQNLRHNVNAGGVTINDGTITYTAPPAPPVAALGVTGSAYTNNDLDANTATTLFALDTSLDQVALQSPANNGILAATGKLTVDTDSSVGFDIFSKVRSGVTVDNEAFASLGTGTGNRTQLYSVSLLTGKAASRGTFSFFNRVVDIAIPLNQ